VTVGAAPRALEHQTDAVISK